MAKPRPTRRYPPLPVGRIPNPRRRKDRGERVQVIMSFGQHGSPEIVKRIARLTKRLKPGDAYLSERAMPQVEAALFEGRHDRLRQILFNAAVSEAKKRGLTIPEETLRRRAEQIAQELIETYRSEPKSWNAVRGMEKFEVAEEQLFKTLRKRGIHILVESLKEDIAYRVAEIGKKLDTQDKEFVTAVETGNFKWAADEFTNLIRGQAELLRLRDVPLYEKLREEIMEKLNNRKGGKIFIRVGQSHTRAYHLLKREFEANPQVKVERVFDHNPLHYTLGEALIRQIAFQRVLPKRELVVKAMFEKIAENALRHQGHKNEKLIVTVTNAAAGKITQDEVKAMFAEIRKEGKEHTDEVILKWMQAKGILKRRN